MLGRRRAGLRGVRGVVHPDAQHGGRPGQRGADPQLAGRRELGQRAGVQRLPDPVQAVAGQEGGVDVRGQPAQIQHGSVGDDGRHLLTSGAETSELHEATPRVEI
jgi:hypothetical protein